MSKPRYAATSLLLSVALLAGPLLQTVRADADERGRENFLPVFARARAPIGTVEAFGQVSIDGRAAQGSEAIWGGELIQASATASVRVQLNAAGQVTLTRGSAARFATAATSTQPVLIAALLNGEFKAQLAPAATAYVEAAGQSLLASAGASFRLSLRDGEATVEAGAGTVWWGQKLDKDELNFVTGGLNRSSGPIPTGAGRGSQFIPDKKDQLSRRTSSRTPIAFKGTRKPTTTAPGSSTAFLPAFQNTPFSPALQASFAPGVSIVGVSAQPLSGAGPPAQAPQAELPAAGLTLILSLDRPELGCLEDPRGGCAQEVEIDTDKDGVAEVFFQALSKRRVAGALTLKVKGTSYVKTWQLEVVPVFFTTPVKIMLGAATLGAGVGIGVLKARDKRPIRPLPPPVILP